MNLNSYFLNNLVLNKLTICLPIISLLAFSVQAENTKTIEELFMNSLIADAIYVDFKDENGVLLGLEDTLADHKDWENELDRVKLITENFQLLDFQPDTSSGFSAGMFQYLQGAHTGENIYASRGTAGAVDIFGADAFGIAAMGVPQFQVRDLYNYIQRLKAPANGSYQYLKKSLFEEFYLDFGTKSDGAGHADWFTSKVDGVGHSLGGNLTSAFGRLYSTDTVDLV